MNGTRLGNYELAGKLGEGGMGEVWRARDHRLNRSVAVKILPSDVAADPVRRLRFEQEARALAALNHPNIVAVYDVGQEDGRAFLVSELVEGESLRAVIDHGPMPARTLIDYAVQMADALAAAHEIGIVHRDFKPENVMVTRSGRVKVLDFGLAKQNAMPRGDEGVTQALSLSTPGMVMGTVGYMSPEQVRGEPADPRSDIFSFGCVLYEMAAGKRAFHAASSIETMHAVLNEDPPELNNPQPSMLPALMPIVRRCLEKRPEQRFQSAADLAFALRSAPSYSTGSGVHPAVERPRPRRWLWLAGAAVAAAVLFAAGFFAAARTLPRDPPNYERVTFRKGHVDAARFTPDSRNVIYGASWDGGPSRIYLAVPGSPESRDLGFPDGSRLLAVSSKEDVAFLHGPYFPNGAGTLARMSVSGGQMRPWLENVQAADWAPDGSSMAILRFVNNLYQLEYPIGNVLLEKMPFPLFGIRVSPDGERVAYAHFAGGSSVGISVIDKAKKNKDLGLVSGQTSNIMDANLAWTPDGREIWFRSFDLKEGGTIYGIGMNGRRRVVTYIPGFASLYDLSGSGHALLSTASAHVGILGAAPGETTERDLSCLDASTVAGMSSDGSIVVANIIGSSGGPKGSIYIRKTDGSPPIRLGDGHAFTVSPDGKWVSGYTSPDRSTRRYVLLPTGAGEERTITPPGLSLAIVFGWLGSGRYFITGAKEGGPFRPFVFDQARNTVEPVGVAENADAAPFVSPDSSRFIAQRKNGDWYVYPMAGGDGQELRAMGPHDRPVGWRSDNRSIYMTTHSDDATRFAVAVYDVATGNRSPWKEIHPARPVDEVTNLAITPDGKAYAYGFSIVTSDVYIGQGLR